MNSAQSFNLVDSSEDAPGKRKLVAVTMEDLIHRDLPPRENILSPWLPKAGLAMIYAKRGVGKTYVALGIAHAVATGGTFLNWTAPKPRRVLYLERFQ